VFGEDLEPATVDDEMGDSFSMRQQSATAAHIRVQPYNAVASSDCRSVLEEVVPWGLVCYLVGMNPEYPGLDDSAEYARWRFLHWISSLV
jgi:hypothetical protein